jgi:hypothetical protein
VDGAVGGEYQPVRHERQQFGGMGAAQHARDIAEIGDTDDDGAAARGCAGQFAKRAGIGQAGFGIDMARLARGMEGGWTSMASPLSAGPAGRAPRKRHPAPTPWLPSAGSAGRRPRQKVWRSDACPRAAWPGPAGPGPPAWAAPARDRTARFPESGFRRPESGSSARRSPRVRAPDSGRPVRWPKRRSARRAP